MFLINRINQILPKFEYNSVHFIFFLNPKGLEIID